MDDGAGNEFIRCEEVQKNPAAGTIELLDRADEEVLVELVCASNVHDVDRVDTSAIRRPVESDAAVTDVLVNMLIRLERKSATGRP